MESRHNPQFCPVRRVKISPFGEQEASHGLILTPLGMTPRARGAAVRLLVVGCAVPAFTSETGTRILFLLREKLFSILKIIFNFLA